VSPYPYHRQIQNAGTAISITNGSSIKKYNCWCFVL